MWNLTIPLSDFASTAIAVATKSCNDEERAIYALKGVTPAVSSMLMLDFEYEVRLRAL